jgi:hypothetical protein
MTTGNDEWWALATIHTKGERVRARRTKPATFASFIPFSKQNKSLSNG